MFQKRRPPVNSRFSSNEILLSKSTPSLLHSPPPSLSNTYIHNPHIHFHTPTYTGIYSYTCTYTYRNIITLFVSFSLTHTNTNLSIYNITLLSLVLMNTITQQLIRGRVYLALWFQRPKSPSIIKGMWQAWWLEWQVDSLYYEPLEAEKGTGSRKGLSDLKSLLVRTHFLSLLKFCS